MSKIRRIDDVFPTLDSKQLLYDDARKVLYVFENIYMEPISPSRIFSYLTGDRPTKAKHGLELIEHLFSKYSGTVLYPSFISYVFEMGRRKNEIYRVDVNNNHSNRRYGVFNYERHLRRELYGNTFKHDYNFEEVIDEVGYELKEKSYKESYIKDGLLRTFYFNTEYSAFEHKMRYLEMPPGDDSAFYVARRFGFLLRTREEIKSYMDFINSKQYNLEWYESMEHHSNRFLYFMFDKSEYTNKIDRNYLIPIKIPREGTFTNIFTAYETGAGGFKNIIYSFQIEDDYEMISRKYLILFNRLKNMINEENGFSFFFNLIDGENVRFNYHFKELYERPIKKELAKHIKTKIQEQTYCSLNDLLLFTEHNYVDVLDLVALFYRENYYLIKENKVMKIKKLDV